MDRVSSTTHGRKETNGTGGSFVAGRALRLPFHVLPEIVVIALAFSATVGMAFGFFPAREAARLNPIQAMRYE